MILTLDDLHVTLPDFYPFNYLVLENRLKVRLLQKA